MLLNSGNPNHAILNFGRNPCFLPPQNKFRRRNETFNIKNKTFVREAQMPSAATKKKTGYFSIKFTVN